MDKETALMDLMRTTVCSNVKTKVCVSPALTTGTAQIVNILRLWQTNDGMDSLWEIF